MTVLIHFEAKETKALRDKILTQLHNRISGWLPSLAERLSTLLPALYERQSKRKKKKKIPGACRWIILVQTYLFYCALLYCASQSLCLLQTEGLWLPVSSKSIGAIFPTALAHFLSLRPNLVIPTILQTFSWLYLLWCSEISDLCYHCYDSLKAQMMVFLAIKYFLFKVCTLFFHT